MSPCFKMPSVSVTELAFWLHGFYAKAMSESQRVISPTDIGALAVSTAHAIGTLDGALVSSTVARIWQERAAIVGLADCLAVAGLSLTPGEFFRGCVGLTDTAFVQSLDRELVSTVAAVALPRLLPAAFSPRLLAIMRRGGGLIIDADDGDLRPVRRLETALADALAMPRTDVGTALEELTGRLGAALALTRDRTERDTPWFGWLAAALMPGAVAAIGLTTTPLPCLTGVSRGLRYRTTTSAETRRMLWTTLGAQARSGLVLLRRLEACAAAWRERLDGVTRRSRAGAGAGLFLVWPALTRGQVATALTLSPAGAAKLLDGLIARDIVTATRSGGRTFYVATESLGDFKLAPCQGLSRSAPPLQPLLDAVDDALAAFDLLGLDLELDAEEPWH